MKRAAIVVCALLFRAIAPAQTFEQKGDLELQLSGFPETTSDDSAHVVGQADFRYDMTYKIASWIQVNVGVEAQTDTHNEIERSWRLDWLNRGLVRPAFEMRTLNLTMHKEHFTAVLGKQFVHWGKADILNPTDHFAPRDYLDVTESELLGIMAARVTLEADGTSIDMVFEPAFTPSRMPLLNQRWTVIPEGLAGSLENASTDYPGQGSYGIRLDHIDSRYELSADFFQGFNTFPLINPTIAPSAIYIERVFPKIRSYGADLDIPTSWFTIKAEGAYYQPLPASSNDGLRADNYFIWVAQLERQIGNWTLIAGYSGQTVTQYGGAIDFDPMRGLTQAILARIAYAIDARRNVVFETATRQNGAGTWTRAEYSQLLGSQWRATVEVAYIGGSNLADFLGQYHRNSYAAVKIRYSF